MKAFKIISTVVAIHLFAIASISAQTPVSLDEAIKLALLNNYEVQIARSEQEISKLNNDWGNAGLLPQLSATAGNTWESNNIHQETNTGSVTDYKNVAASTANAAIGFTWTLFDGTKMFATHQKLNELEKLGEIKTRMAMEDLVYRVISQYYSLVKIKQQITLSESLLELYQKRKQVADAKNSTGSSSGLEVLQAQADLNAQTATLLKLKSQYMQVQFAFAKLVMNNPQTSMEVSDSLNMAPLTNMETVKSNLKQNSEIKSAETYLKIADLSSREARSGYFPKIGFGAGYEFSKSDNAASYLLQNHLYGPSFGFTASWNLFNGMAVNRNVKSAKIQQKMMKLTFDEVNLQLETSLLSQYKLYESNLQIATLEEQNILGAQTALSIAMEKYSMGMINDIQLKEVQRTFEDAQLRLITARYDVKISETELLRLQGLLIK